jgi:hypothetical protein
MCKFVRKDIDDDQLEAVYQNWLARRIVNRPASDMLRAGWFYEGIQGDDLKRLEEACKAFHLEHVLLSGLILLASTALCTFCLERLMVLP